jgi:hypothetical protein
VPGNDKAKDSKTAVKAETVQAILRRLPKKGRLLESAEQELQDESASQELADEAEVVLENPSQSSQKKPAFPSGKASNGTAAARWIPKEIERGVWEFKSGNNAVVDRGDRVTGSNGSPEEAQKMLEMGIAKRWNPMAFSGDAAFKEAVMNAALEGGLEVKAISPADQDLYKRVKQRFDADQQTRQRGGDKRETAPKDLAQDKKGGILERSKDNERQSNVNEQHAKANEQKRGGSALEESLVPSQQLGKKK